MAPSRFGGWASPGWSPKATTTRRFGWRLDTCPDTPLPWSAGNSALAGHRDGEFRPLSRLLIGDEVELTTERGTFRYRIRATKIVQPEDLSVLASTSGRTLTLITCYPFVYIGHAPQRFIVIADAIS